VNRRDQQQSRWLSELIALLDLNPSPSFQLLAFAASRESQRVTSDENHTPVDPYGSEISILHVNEESGLDRYFYESSFNPPGANCMYL
jgi:hypothetical protein